MLATITVAVGLVYLCLQNVFSFQHIIVKWDYSRVGCFKFNTTVNRIQLLCDQRLVSAKSNSNGIVN